MIATNVGTRCGGTLYAIANGARALRQKRVVLTPDMLASSSGKLAFSGATVARELRLTGESAL